MNGNLRSRRVDRLALALFGGLALLLTAPALFSGGKTVCAANAPDTWVHMWAFWRTHYALSGKDVGYVISHVITYPGILREPIAVFDPLLPLVAAALHTGLRNIPMVFNLLVALGLMFTGMAGYKLSSRFTWRPAAALIGGCLAAANPFLYRQLAAGYTEYAWWGLVPFTAWLYLNAIRTDGAMARAGYVISLLFTFLLSIYCAAVFAVFAALALAMEVVQALRRKPNSARRAFRLQLLALVALLPLFFFWIHHLEQMGYRGIPVNQSFSPRDVRAVEALSDGNARVGIDRLDLFTAWRTLHGSLDAADLVGLRATWRAKEARRADNPQPVPFLAGAEIAYAESVFGLEWLFPLLLAAVALTRRDTRVPAFLWLSAGAVFLVAALGPFLIWNGKALTAVSLPYGWLYHRLPGFARLNIPGRAFLGTLLCLIVPTAQGADILISASLRRCPGSGRRRAVGLALALLLFFAWTGYGRLTLPTTRIAVSPLYRRIARRPGSFALLELPLRGDLDARLFSQTVHQKPIHRGIPATFMTDIQGMSAVEENVLVTTLNMEAPRLPPDAAPRTALEWLIDQGFRFLVLHADGYDTPEAYAAAQDIVTGLRGNPWYADRQLSAWELTP